MDLSALRESRYQLIMNARKSALRGIHYYDWSIRGGVLMGKKKYLAEMNCLSSKVRDWFTLYLLGEITADDCGGVFRVRTFSSNPEDCKKEILDSLGERVKDREFRKATYKGDILLMTSYGGSLTDEKIRSAAQYREKDLKNIYNRSVCGDGADSGEVKHYVVLDINPDKLTIPSTGYDTYSPCAVDPHGMGVKYADILFSVHDAPYAGKLQKAEKTDNEISGPAAESIDAGEAEDEEELETEEEASAGEVTEDTETEEEASAGEAESEGMNAEDESETESEEEEEKAVESEDVAAESTDAGEAEGEKEPEAEGEASDGETTEDTEPEEMNAEEEPETESEEEEEKAVESEDAAAESTDAGDAEGEKEPEAEGEASDGETTEDTETEEEASAGEAEPEEMNAEDESEVEAEEEPETEKTHEQEGDWQDIIGSIEDSVSDLSESIDSLTKEVNELAISEASARETHKSQDNPSGMIFYSDIDSTVRLGDKVYDENQLTDYIVDAVHEKRPNYSDNDILNIAVCITQGFLTVFSGAPGCGKTSVCDIFADVLGLRTIAKYAEGSCKDQEKAQRYASVSVEEGWTSRRDFIGYYNPLTGSIEAAQSNHNVYDIMQELNAECSDNSCPLDQNNPSVYPCVILLDEANLSPVEYYWSDFMKVGDIFFNESYARKRPGEGEKADYSRPTVLTSIYMGKAQDDTGRDVDVDFKVADSLRFVATINNDYTTSELSPRLTDRAWVITLPKADSPEADTQDASAAGSCAPSAVIALKDLQNAFDHFTEDEVRRKWNENPCGVKDIYRGLKDRLNDMRISLSPRTENAIFRYWAAGAAVFKPDKKYANEAVDKIDKKETNEFRKVRVPDSDELQPLTALDYAVAQRILPHIGGSGERYGSSLKRLKDYCAVNNLLHSYDILCDILDRSEDEGMNYYKFFG